MLHKWQLKYYKHWLKREVDHNIPTKKTDKNPSYVIKARYFPFGDNEMLGYIHCCIHI